MKIPFGSFRSAFDAREIGAKCDECPFAGTCVPVPPDRVTDPTLIVVADHPSANDAAVGRPMVGATGMLWNRILRSMREDRTALYVTHAVMCLPVKGATPEQWHAAIAACRPRLEAELAALDADTLILTYGDRALEAFQGTNKIFEFLGVPMVGKIIPRTILPSLHPKYALPHKAPAYESVINIHTKRAFRYVDGKLSEWEWPEIYTDQDGDEKILAALERLMLAPTLGVDVETPKIVDPTDWPRLAKMLLNIGVASADLKLAVCVTWPTAGPPVREAMLRLLASNIPKTMHNGSFDSKVFRYNEIELGNWDYDSMIAWQICAPKLKAGLDFVSCVLTNAPRWKDEFRAHARSKVAASDDEVLDYFLKADPVARAIYCAKDSYLQDFLRKVQRFYFDDDRRRIFEQRMRLTKIGLKMYHAGVLIDEPTRQKYRRPYEIKMRWSLRKLRRIARRLGFEKWKEKKKIVWDYETIATKKGKIKTRRIPGTRRQEVVERTALPFDPGNIHHIRELFERCLGVRGRAGDPGKADSFDANVMIDFQKHVRPEVRYVASEIVRYRKAEKILSTFIDGLPIYPDGKIHIEWKPGQTATLRWASSNPNGQNIPQILRGMFSVTAGYYLVYADFSQLELRIVALVAKDLPLLEAYAKGIDVHAANAADIFGDEFRRADDAGKAKQRDFAKRFVYGANYNALAQTLWESLVTGGGKAFENLKLSTVKAALAAWFRAHVAIKEWQNKTLDRARRENRAFEPVLYRHSNPFFGNFDPSVAVNFPIQTFASFLANTMIERVAERLNWDDGESILFMIHDAVALQVRDPVLWADLLVDLGTQTVEHDGVSMTFPLDVAVSGRTMKPVVAMKRGGEFARPKAPTIWQSRKKLWRELEEAGIV